MNNTGIYHRSINSTYENWPEIVSSLCLRYKNWRKEFNGIFAEYEVKIERFHCVAQDERLIVTNGCKCLLVINTEGWNNNVFKDGSVYYYGGKNTEFYPGLIEHKLAGAGELFKFDYCNLPEEEHFQLSLMYNIADYKTCISVLDKFVELDCYDLIYTFYPEFFDDSVLSNINKFLKGYDDA